MQETFLMQMDLSNGVKVYNANYCHYSYRYFSPVDSYNKVTFVRHPTHCVCQTSRILGLIVGDIFTCLGVHLLTLPL